jgi:hypothetical protein
VVVTAEGAWIARLKALPLTVQLCVAVWALPPELQLRSSSMCWTADVVHLAPS